MAQHHKFRNSAVRALANCRGGAHVKSKSSQRNKVRKELRAATDEYLLARK